MFWCTVSVQLGSEFRGANEKTLRCAGENRSQSLVRTRCNQPERSTPVPVPVPTQAPRIGSVKGNPRPAGAVLLRAGTHSNDPPCPGFAPAYTLGRTKEDPGIRAADLFLCILQQALRRYFLLRARKTISLEASRQQAVRGR